MKILALDSSGLVASAAILDEESVIAEYTMNYKKTHSQTLLPMVDEIVRMTQQDLKTLDAIAVAAGPGSFTGLRIGSATAKGLGQALNKPLISVPTLEGLAYNLFGSESIICPMMDARRKQVYGAAYELAGEGGACDADAAGLVCRIPEASILMVDFLKEVDKIADQFERILFLGDGIDTCGDLIGAWAQEHAAASTVAAGAAAPEIASGEPSAPEITCVPESIRYQDAAAVALRGWQLFREGKDCQYIELQPEYLRMAEAEKKLRDRQAAEAAQAGRKGNT